MGVPVAPVTACALAVAVSVDDSVACFRSVVREKLDICPVHDNPDLQICPVGGTLPIHLEDDVGLLRHDLAATGNHKGSSASDAPSVLATAGVPAVAMAEQPWNSGR